MKMTMRKMLAILATLAILCTVLPLGALFSAVADGDNLFVNGDFEAGNADASGDNIDVEFVLDSTLAYRFYITNENAKYLWAKVTYVDRKGVSHVVDIAELNFSEAKELYYFDFTLAAYEFNAKAITIELMNGNTAIETVAYEISDYYAEIAGGSNETLKALVRALNAYATYANIYMVNSDSAE